jgi:hypothetical protein
MNPHKRDNRRPPPPHFRFEPPPARAKFVVTELIRTGRRTFDDVGDPEPQLQEKRSLKRRKQPWRKTPGIKRRPEPVPRPAKVPPDGSGVKARVDPRKQHDQIFRDKIRYELVARRQKLGFGGFPGSDHCPLHNEKVAFYLGALLHARRQHSQNIGP